MKRWTCTHCGAVERLTFYPDACSSCGGPMVSDDERSTARAEPEIPFDVYQGAADGYADATIEMWHLGAPRGTYSQQVLDTLILQNRHEQLVSLYREAA